MFTIGIDQTLKVKLIKKAETTEHIDANQLISEFGGELKDFDWYDTLKKIDEMPMPMYKQGFGPETKETPKETPQ